MQGSIFMPDEHLQSSTPPPNKSTVPPSNMDLSPGLNLVTKDSNAHQSNQSDSGIQSATGSSTYLAEMDSSNRSENDESDNRSSCSSPDRKYLCPICEITLTSQHEFTVHIRSHNNESDPQDSEKGFICRICSKVLSSGASLDRHVLIHSGERPFTCKHCGDTFTTNGNMHRHMRTHTNRTNYESDGSSDSGASGTSKNIEYNNNKVISDFEGNSGGFMDYSLNNKRKSADIDENENTKKFKLVEFSATGENICPVCKRDDFISAETLAIHLEDNHSDYPVKCKCCDQTFKNSKLLKEHKSVTYANDMKNQRGSVIGFTDLTFIDFSSQKFPHIARRECEKNVHKAATGLKFRCEKCHRDFPCEKALHIHNFECSTGLDLTTKNRQTSIDYSNNMSKQEIHRSNFFAKLDLKTNFDTKIDETKESTGSKSTISNCVRPVESNTKDLADIQSIISITTSGGLLQHLQAKSNEVNKNFLSESELDKQDNEEESQDLFAAEFRKMKMRGEFPCRLCTDIFPNLRALKGHNRSHLNSSNSGMYRCNMCPHSSLDKAALIRHMRTHNGDRPYECSLCNYAFTTKANCERHLRNRHAKNTREEVKKSIIYHPSEDPSNEEISKMLSREETAKVSTNSATTPKLMGDYIPEKIKTVSPLSPTPKPVMPVETNIEFSKEHLEHDNTQSSTNNPPIYSPQFLFYPKNENTSTPHKTIPKISVKNLETLQNSEEVSRSLSHSTSDENFEADDSQMNIALDLSKKKCVSSESPDAPTKFEMHPESPQDLSKKKTDFAATSPNEILAQHLLKSKIDPSELYASQLAMYRNGFSPIPALPAWPFPINPLLFQTIANPLMGQETQDIKERLQRLQLCGGGMVMDNFAERLKNFHQQSIINQGINSFANFKANPDINADGNSHKLNLLQCQPKLEDIKPLTLSVEQNLAENIMKMQSPILTPSKQDHISSPNSVKMVIKNGVLMPKQKQRRYRTERPFSCEFCSARFTLRSNMERHIKQQHPQYWSQRHKSNGTGSGRKPHSANNQRQNYCNINIPIYDTPKKENFEENKEADKLKYALLAQQLKEVQNLKTNFVNKKIKEEEEDDYPLIIDEKEDSRIKEKVDPNLSNKSISEALIGNDFLKDKFKQFIEHHNASKDQPNSSGKQEETQDLVPVARLLDNASQQPFKEYFNREGDTREEGISEEEEEGLVASSSTSEENNSGTDENRSESEQTSTQTPVKKKSAYSLAPNRVSCPYCQRKFPWTSSLRRHVLTHTGQKPFKCSHCPLLFTTKSNCDRHLLRKHGNSATAINNNDMANSQNYMMRNVPERPYKCSSCPSSTFSTYSNLKKHITSKHSSALGGAQSDDARSQVSTGYEGGSSEDEKVYHSDQKNDWEKQISSTNKAVGNLADVPSSHSDLPFKCHLCDSSFGERHDTLDHIKERHYSEYDLLMSKNAFDENATTPDENPNHEDNEENEVRGRFPDYANRKVICAFCMRRFWSAEDLRRHMRTHTGERPFSCDVCHRRFTLKHSMLRHRKKHNLSSENDQVNSDEDANGTVIPPSYNVMKSNINNNLVGKIGEKTDESDGTESDLISNLLGIRDRSIIDQVLTASADDAAKLLGVRNGDQE